MKRFFERLRFGRKARVLEIKPMKKTTDRLPQLHGQELIFRISDIWQIPTREIQPIIKTSQTQHGELAYGDYDRKTHTITLSRNSEEDKSHELTHAGYSSIMPEKERKRWNKKSKAKFDVISFLFGGGYPKKVQDKCKDETIAGLAEQKYCPVNAIRILSLFSFNAGVVGLFLNGIAGAAIITKATARTVEMLLSRKPVKNIYKIHGIDGIILFIANPPRVFGAIETGRWRRKMIKQGNLKENGGLTEKGIQLLRQVMPKEDILKRMRIAEQNRKAQ